MIECIFRIIISVFPCDVNPLKDLNWLTLKGLFVLKFECPGPSEYEIYNIYIYDHMIGKATAYRI